MKEQNYLLTNNLTLRQLVLCVVFLLLGIQSARGQQGMIYPRTNLLLPLMNIGVEVPIGQRWSVAADYNFPWIPRKSNHKNCFQIDGFALEGRYWLGNRSDLPKEKRLLGHSVGLFTMAGHYDLERNYKGHQGEYILGGVDYLYAIPIFKGKLHLEFSLGVGFLYSEATHYEVFEEGGRGYRDKDFRKKIEYFGPLKAGVALVVPFRLICPE